MVEKTAANLEQTVKSLLRQHSMSMRQLAALTGIHVATISKMLLGKQRINPEYLEKIAEHLSVHPTLLYQAAGLKVADHVEKNDHLSLHSYFKDIIDYTGYSSVTLNRQSIMDELLKYDGYAKTSEGKLLIEEKFPEKRQQIFGTGPFIDELDNMYERYIHGEISEKEKMILGSGLLYFVLATDAIPDFMFPIGYLDDALAIQITQERLMEFSKKT
ncbi:helix-turn-helix domain-containing protein [Alicyclobacillus tolerans]|uniref:helix-turn-helix domain-containing protein n=1 Tax=Alicyclobacillus TaxID=29330 RepID=UPI001EE42E77|nr:helix-turn-helix domain-containing protein [Alicyclobacillus sp. TC]